MQVTELFSLKDKVAAVVGGTGVLGATFCRGLADAGALVAVLGRPLRRAWRGGGVGTGAAWTRRDGCDA